MANRTYMAWVMAAMVLDRLYLLVFFFATAILTLTLMTYQPTGSRLSIGAYQTGI